MTSLSRITPQLLAQAHQRQFNGEDWQTVAVDLIGYITAATDDEFNELCSSPDPGCECGFCRTAEWGEQ